MTTEQRRALKLAASPGTTSQEDSFELACRLPTPASAPVERMTIVIDYDEGEPLGCVPDDHLVIVGVQKMTAADGKLRIGDRLLSMNGRLVKDKDRFYQFAKRMHPQVIIQVERQIHKTPLTDDRAALIHLKPDTTINDYFVAHLSRIPGSKIGLTVKTSDNGKVIVTKLEPFCLAERCYEVGDYILDVNGEQVSSKDSAKLLLKKGLQVDGYVSTIVERVKPEIMKSLRKTRRDRIRNPKVANDVIHIGRREVARIKHMAKAGEGQVPKPKSILIHNENLLSRRERRKTSPKPAPKPSDSYSKRKAAVKFYPRNIEMNVQSDIKDPTKLIPVPRDRHRSSFDLSQARMPQMGTKGPPL
uniref:PDZ domain-containing protein n=1 Tax=Panagrellus redivivus TaxID=6233 RepID=A0A7E4VTU6_PANRE